MPSPTARARRLAKTAAPQTPAAIQAAYQQQGMDNVSPFGPGRPLNPAWGYSVRPRQTDYPTGININVRNRQAWGRPAFETIKAIIDAYDIARICINHKIDELRSMEPLFVPADGYAGHDLDDAVDAARAALAFPDRELPFDAWLSKLLENALRYDATPLYKRRNMNGDIIAYEVLDGTTIFPLVDDHGRRPRPPAEAYQQVIKGMVAVDFTSDDLDYLVFRPQPSNPFGMAPIESILLTVNTDIRFQWHFLQMFTEGSVPGGFIETPEDVTSPDQVAEFQDYWDSMIMGDQAKLHQLVAVPHGVTITNTKPDSFDSTFPEYLMTRTCGAYGVVPQDLGLIKDVNRANGETQTDIQFRVNTLPWVRWVEGILSRYLTALYLPVKVQLDTGRDKEDRLQEAQAWAIYIDNGMASPDEGRQELLGLPIDNERPMPRFINNPRTGPVPLSNILAIAGQVDPETGAPVDDVPLSLTPFAGAHGVLPDKAPGGTQFTRAPINPDEPEFPELEKPVPGSDVVGTTPGKPVIGDANPSGIPGAQQITKTDGVTAETGLEGLDLPGLDEDDVEVDLAVVEVAKQAQQHRYATDRAAAELHAFTRFCKARERSGKWRDFEFEHVPDSVAAVLNEQARDSILVKASDADPKAPSWRDGAPKAPQHHYDLRLTDHYQPLIAAALGNLLPAAALRSAIETAASITLAKATSKAKDVYRTAAKDALAGLATDPDALERLMRQLVTDSWLAGGQAAGDQLGAAAVTLDGVSDVDWDHWKPGQADAADLAANGGLADLLDQAGATVQGITGTLLDELGNRIGDGLAAGDSIDDIAATLAGIVSDPSRAEMIAHTETTRAISAATTASYQANGVSEWDWLLSDDACPECEEQADGNPHQTGDAAPPLHPRCRCAQAPRASSVGAQPDTELAEPVDQATDDTSGFEVE